MKELKLTQLSTGNFSNYTSMNLKFINGGSVVIPPTPGAYVVASGCGSGKTTLIKEIIRRKSEQGILYSASTIRECNEMYEWVKEMYTSEGRLNFLKNDVIVLHSDYRSEGTDNNLWRNNPEEIMYKSIIICTHHKLLNEYPELLIGYKRNTVPIKDINYIDRASLTKSGDGTLIEYPRRYILIDELPTCDSLSIKINRMMLASLGDRDGEWKVNSNGKKYLDHYLPIRYYNPSFERLEYLYDNTIPDSMKLVNGNDELSKFKERMLLSIIDRNYEFLANEYDEKEVSIKYNVTELAQSLKNSICILFDGTGDLTFVDSKVFKLLTFPNKYNSPISLNRIEYNLRRYQKPNSDENLIKNELEKNILKLKEIIDNNPEGTLIVTWMNLKEDNYRITKGTLNITNNLLNEEFSLPEYYKKRLEQLGVTNPFEIIHYMSGLDKATNKFRNFSSIVFLGEFHVPNYVVSEFNCEYSCNTNSDNYLTYQLVQAVCRTRIRNHNGESINIYYTEDWSEECINNLINYISSNKVIRRDTSLEFIKPKWRNQCRELMKINKEFNNLITGRMNGQVNFSLDEIYKAIPLSSKEVRKYYPLINYFKKIGIEIVIDTTWGNNQYTSR